MLIQHCWIHLQTVGEQKLLAICQFKKKNRTISTNQTDTFYSQIFQVEQNDTYVTNEPRLNSISNHNEGDIQNDHFAFWFRLTILHFENSNLDILSCFEVIFIRNGRYYNIYIDIDSRIEWVTFHIDSNTWNRFRFPQNHVNSSIMSIPNVNTSI